MKHANSVVSSVTQRGRSSATGHARQPEGLSELDRRIVAALQIDPRASWRWLAEIVDSSESTVARRARALASAGACRSVAMLDPIRGGLGHALLVQLRFQSG